MKIKIYVPMQVVKFVHDQDQSNECLPTNSHITWCGESSGPSKFHRFQVTVYIHTQTHEGHTTGFLILKYAIFAIKKQTFGQ